MPVTFPLSLAFKFETSVAAYLVSAGAATAADIFTSFYKGDRTYPNTTIFAVNAVPEVNNTGNHRITAWVSIKGAEAQADGEPNSQLSLLQFLGRVKATEDALNQTDDNETLKATAQLITDNGRALAVDASNGADPVQVQNALNFADMANFTCQEWHAAGFRRGAASEEGCSWEQVLIFSALACSSNVD